MTAFTAVFAKGTDSKNETTFIDRAVLIETNCGVLEEDVRICSAAKLADNLGLFERVRSGPVFKRKYNSGGYKITFDLDSFNEYTNISIEKVF